MSCSFLSAFTNQMEALGDELSNLFPQDVDLKTATNMIRLLKKTNPRKLLSLFNQFVLGYREKILARDESFFLDHTFNEFQDKQQNSTESLIKQLKTHWKEMSPTSKKATWDYFIVLIKLSDKIG